MSYLNSVLRRRFSPLVSSSATCLGVARRQQRCYSAFSVGSTTGPSTGANPAPVVKARIYSVEHAHKPTRKHRKNCVAATSPAITTAATNSSSTSPAQPAAAHSNPKSWILSWAAPGEFLTNPFKFRSCQDAVTFAAGQGWDYTVEVPVSTTGATGATTGAAATGCACP